MILALVFIVFTALFVNIFIKLSHIIGVFTDFSSSTCINFLLIISCLAVCFYLPLHCSCVFLLMLYMFLICLRILTILIHHQVLFFFIFMLILTKMIIAFKVIITPLQKIFGYFFQPLLFLKNWFSKSGNITLMLFLFLVVYLLLFLHKHIKTPVHQETIRSCSRYEFFTSDFIDTCEDIQSLITQLTINHYSISKFKCQNLNLFSHLLLLLSGDISLNPGPVHQDTLQCSNEWSVFKNRGLHFIHLNINSFLPKIEEVRYIAKSTNAAVIGICESELDVTVLDPEILLIIIKFCVVIETGKVEV